MQTKRYNVYGIGNALVDLEFTLNSDFFNNMNIEKGVMTLIDEDRHHTLLKNLGSPKKKACGGSAANTVIALSQFGGKSFYSCKVAHDEMGEFYLADLKQNGVETNPHLEKDQMPTGKCIVMVTPDADRTMNTYLGITTNFSTNELNEDILKDSEYVYIEGYLVASPTAQSAALKCKELAAKNNVKTALTFSDPNMVKFFHQNFVDIIGTGVDLLFCNESEAIEFTKKSTIKEASSELKKIAKTFVITLGKSGALVYDGEQFIEVSAFPVTAIDTNGAGDMFAGAFLYGITHGHTFAQAGKLASLASSKIVGKYGPRLESEETKAVLHQLTGELK
ncbi:MAG: adenosine kinase [Bacteriovoracaceae bacterium]